MNGSKQAGDSPPVQSKGTKTIYINSIRIISKYVKFILLEYDVITYVDCKVLLCINKSVYI